jgi:hypothetical protein
MMKETAPVRYRRPPEREAFPLLRFDLLWFLDHAA